MRIYLIVVGVALLLLGLTLAARRARVAVLGVSTAGRIRGHRTSTLDEGTAYLPVVEFYEANGRPHTFTSVAGRSTRNPDVGAEVRVRYLPSDPQVAYIQSFLHMWAAPLACALLGIGALYGAWQL